MPFATQRIGIDLNPQGQAFFSFLPFPVGNVEKEVALAQKIQERAHGIMGILPKAKVTNLENPAYGGECDVHGTLQILLSSKLSDKTLILSAMAHEVQHAAEAIKGIRASNSRITALGGSLSKLKKEFKFIKKQHDDPIAKIGAEIALRSSTPRRKVFQKLGNIEMGSPEYIEALELQKQFKQTLRPEYRMATNAAHDAFPFEQRAIKRQLEEETKSAQITTKILSFIFS